jgi:hypothetical protein
VKEKHISLISVPIPEFLTTATHEPAKEIGKALSNIFSIMFHPINKLADKLRMKYHYDLETFKYTLHEKSIQTSEKESTLCIVGLALAISKNNIEEEILKQPFAPCIVSLRNSEIILLMQPSLATLNKDKLAKEQCKDEFQIIQIFTNCKLIKWLER